MELKSFCVLLMFATVGWAQVVVLDERYDNFGEISSPGFPHDYPPNTNMTWKIVTDPGFVIEIDITDFYLEASYDEDMGGKCVYDYVTISDGDEIETFCGNRQQHRGFAPSYKPYVSDTNEVIVNFVSDYSNDEDGIYGFRIAYSKVDADECALIREGSFKPDLNWDEALYCNHHCVNYPGSYKCLCRPGYELHEDGHTCAIGCDEPKIFTEATGVITSNSFPYKYSKYSDCTYKIQAAENQTIELTFDLNFHIEDHFEEDDCPYDRLTVTIHDVDHIYCGTEAPYGGDVIRTQANEVTLHFQSDRTLEYSGFNCTYNIIDLN